MLPKSLGASDSDSKEWEIVMVNSEEMNAGRRPGPRGASVFPDNFWLFLHVIHTVYKHCMFVRTDEPHVIRSSSELTNPISLSSLTNLISLLVPLHKLSFYLVLCKMTRNYSVCKQYVCTNSQERRSSQAESWKLNWFGRNSYLPLLKYIQGCCCFLLQ